MFEFFYILNVTLLLLHEIESSYEREWEILKIPGKTTGFLLLNIPIIFIFFYGLYCIIKYPQIKLFISIIIGTSGFIPFLIHKIISNIIIIGNIFSGVVLIILGIIKNN